MNIKKKYFLMACLIFCVVACSSNESPKKENLAIIKTITGEKIDFNHLKRNWVVVNYWANWCEPCKKEIPELNAFAQTHDNVYMVGVNYDGVDNHQLTELIAKNDIHYFNAMLDPSSELGLGDIPGLPVTFVFNQQGQLAKTLYGPQTEKSLAKVIS